MAESDDGSFILIEATSEKNHSGEQCIQQHVVFATGNNPTASMDAWSEVSAPSIRSGHSSKSRRSGKSAKNPQQATSTASTISFFSKALLQNSLTMIPGLTASPHHKHGHRKATDSEQDYFIIPGNNDREASPVLSSDTEQDDSKHVDSNLHGNDHDDAADDDEYEDDQGHPARAASISSVGSRVPFSWAEIAKIQPQFQGHSELHPPPKVFQQTKIETRYRQNAALVASSSVAQNVTIAQAEDIEDVNVAMAAIPESDPFATKSDLGRRIRRAGKRGSRLKHPNGKKGGNKNAKKKQQQK